MNDLLMSSEKNIIFTNEQFDDSPEEAEIMDQEAASVTQSLIDDLYAERKKGSNNYTCQGKTFHSWIAPDKMDMWPFENLLCHYIRQNHIGTTFKPDREILRFNIKHPGLIRKNSYYSKKQFTILKKGLFPKDFILTGFFYPYDENTEYCIITKITPVGSDEQALREAILLMLEKLPLFKETNEYTLLYSLIHQLKTKYEVRLP